MKKYIIVIILLVFSICICGSNSYDRITLRQQTIQKQLCKFGQSSSPKSTYHYVYNNIDFSQIEYIENNGSYSKKIEKSDGLSGVEIDFFISITTSEVKIGYQKDTRQVISVTDTENGGKAYTIDNTTGGYTWIFTIDENVNTGTIGYSWNLSGIPYVVCFNNTKNFDSVITHEILHALELAHPFDGYSRNTPFNHHFGTTNNIMDYSQTFCVLPNYDTKTHLATGNPLPADAIGLFHWQWQIINTKIL